MTEMKMLQVLELYRAKVGGYVSRPEPYPHDTLLRTDWDGLKHIWHLMNLMEVFIRDKQVEKAMRWLGFIQGVLWACRVYDINELKSHNRPDDQEKEFFNPDRDLREPPVPDVMEHASKTAPVNYVPCALPPEGWECSRPAGHQGPCAASPTAAYVNDIAARHVGVSRQHGVDPGGNPIPRPANYVHRETPMAGNQPAKTARGERFPKGTPVKILAGGAVGSFGKLGVVEDHIEEGYAVRLEGTTEVIYAESVEYSRSSGH